jgi:hypothetical protein
MQQILPLGYPGALSRSDNKTEICSDCGVDEAMLQWAGIKLGTTNNWPLKLVHISDPVKS